jgi:hypothetical protein
MVVEGQRLLADAMRQLVNRDARHGRQGPEPNQHSDFKDFLDTKPPLFKEAEEPLQADEWLNIIEQKFRLLRLTNELKTELLRINCMVQLVFGGVITTLHYPLMPNFRGNSSRQLSDGIIFLPG